MGNILFYDIFARENNAESGESIINLSENCISMLIKGVSNDLPNNGGANCSENFQMGPITDSTPSEGVHQAIEDDKMMKRMKVMDDVHSNKNGLTIPQVNDLLDTVESQVEKIRPQVCSTYLLLMCLNRNENCMIKCKKLIDEFIDCVDKSRIEIVKEKVVAENQNDGEETMTNRIMKEY
ncbi:hypothetical protein JTB14_021272 [Gonioctena quinquepunctata]|nr:hypothetical protein JTB14_021272 [Gonioctena quinquepunctata]